MKPTMKILLSAFAALLLLGACSSTPPADFPIAARPLAAGELPLDSFGKTLFAARSFDVVNQDVAADKNTGLAGKVEPMPVDILSAYAARKFRANGGPFATRFVIRKAEFAVNSVSVPETHWPARWFADKDTKAEMTVDLSVSLVASRGDGMDATVNATSTQSQQLGVGTSVEDRRTTYLQLMSRALQGLDGELNKQLAQYFSDVMVR